VVVAPGAHLGRDCNLSHGAVIGGRGSGAPWIGDRVYLGPGARIEGMVRIGNDAAIGAHSVVTEDVADGAVIGGGTAKLLHLVHGRRRPPMADQLRGFLRAVMPRPTQLLLRTA
jgi:serine acetyltransferase